MELSDVKSVNEYTEGFATSAVSTLSPAATSSPSRIATAITWTSSVTAFLAPALWNGFALVFFDTGGYMKSVQKMTLEPGRSFFYGLFLWATSFGWWSFWGPVLAQSLFTVWVIHLMLRCHDLPANQFVTTFFCLGLGLSTGISWYTSQLMPDAFIPLVVLALWLLGFRWERLGQSERWGLAVLALLGLMSHMSCMALAIGLAGVILMARFAERRRGWNLSVRCLPPLAVVAASLVLMPMAHLALSGKAIYTPGGKVFIFGRLVQDGIAQRWLAEHCPVSDIKLCRLQDRLPDTAGAFLWGYSPLQDIGGWSGAEPELGRLVNECFRAYPGAVVWTSLRAAAQQMSQVATGDGLDEFQGYTRGVFSGLTPRVARQFKAACQQQGRSSRSLFDALNQVHIPVAHLSLLGLLLVMAWGLYFKRHDLAGLAFFTLLALLGNAFICGALSCPNDRYQSRLVWLATLVVAMAVVSWWPLRTKKQRLPASRLNY